MTDPRSGQQLDDLFHRLPVALYRTSAQGDVLAANDATARLLGYESAGELLARENAADAAHVDPAERREWRRLIDEAGVVHDFHTRLRRRDGEVIWVRDTARAVFDDAGKLRFYEGALVDITSEVRATLSTSILSGVLEATTDLVMVFDQVGTLRFANGAARAFLGVTENFVLTRPGFDAVFPTLSWDEAYAATVGGFSGEIALPDREGRRCPFWVVVTRHDGGANGTFVAAIARDLTQVKETQRRLERLVASKDVVVATVSHELRNPLTGVMGLAEELRDRFDEFGDQERHDLITLIAHQAAEMTSLVEDLLVAVRSDVGEVAVVPQRVDVVAQLQEIIGRRIDELIWELPEGRPAAWVDPQRFRQIVRNLLSNAERHGGQEVRIKVAETPDGVVVTVSDNGSGVPSGEVERIFEPFQRVDGAPIKQGSVGLGLSVSRRLARLMGGDLEYVEEGGWATFRLTVPTAEGLRLSAS